MTSIELIAGEGRGDSSGKGKAEASTDFTQLGSPKNVVGNNGVAGYGEVVVLKMSGWGGELDLGSWPRRHQKIVPMASTAVKNG